MTQPAILHITEHGDDSVGIFDSNFDLVFPYEVDINDPDDLNELDHFKQSAKALYDLFCQNRTSADWDFDLKNEALNER